MTTLTKTNSIHRSPLLRGLLLIPLVLAGFALLPRAQAQTPEAGVTPLAFVGTNTFDGFHALDEITTGIKNSAFGAWALQHNQTGNQNTAVGSQALRFNTASFNTAIGDNALLFNTTGSQNMALGQGALANNLTGSNNVAMGFQTLNRNTTGFINTANGAFALHNNSTGDSNTATGFHALSLNETGSQNTAIGDEALFGNVSGFQNTAVGVGALNNNGGITGGGSRNTAVGAFALGSNPTGNNNIALGNGAGNNLLDGNNNIDIGNPGGSPVVFVESGTTRIGFVQTRTFIAGIRGRTTGVANAVPVLIDSNGQLGTVSSSRRFKKEIKPMDQISDSILALKPVTFHYKSDSTGTPQFGLIAEEVAQANPDLVVRDENGEIYTVRYDAVNAMLLNEFLKEHRKNEEQEKRIDALTAQIKEQAERIQKVIAQIEASKPAPQVVNNP
jgi:Chaperone of endosialidase